MVLLHYVVKNLEQKYCVLRLKKLFQSVKFELVLHYPLPVGGNCNASKSYNVPLLTELLKQITNFHRFLQLTINFWKNINGSITFLDLKLTLLL